MALNYREKALRIGKAHPLLAIHTEPPGGAAPNGIGVVLLNAGLLHRVGPSRLHVQIARRLAPLGFQVIRFDFSGIGDSDARRDGLAFEQSAVIEVQEAMDHLAATRGIREFTLIGLCSGADAAFLTAVADARVTRLIQLDPWVYRTWKFHVVYWLRKATSAHAWRNVFNGRTPAKLLRRLRAASGSAGSAETNENVVVAHYAREFPPREQVRDQLAALLARRVRMLCLFSGGMPADMAYGHQYADCFPELDLSELVTVHHDASADHMFSALRHQRMVVETTESWMTKSSAAPAVEAKLATA
jgi:pimeloyl-ACP methyl ester carboxylesterase